MTAPTQFIDRIEQGLDDATRAILDLAFVAPELTESAFGRILSTLAPGHGDAIRQIAEDLTWALDFRTDPPAQVLARFYDVHISATWIYADRHCDHLAEEKETDAVRAAQLVASLIVRGAAA